MSLVRFPFHNPKTGYTVENAMLLDGSAQLTFTPSTNGDRQACTYSFWAKRCLATTEDECVLAAGDGTSNNFTQILLDTGADRGLVARQNETTFNLIKRESAKRQDPAAWSHYLVAFDTTQALAADRVKLYVNGEQITNFDLDTVFAQNTNTFYNSTAYQMVIGRNSYNTTADYESYLTEFHGIDGQALDPSSFGESVDGIWVPKKYSGGHGTNGFYLDGADANDKSGNANHWTNSGVEFGIMDSPTNNASLGVGDGPVMNPLIPVEGGGYPTFSNGNRSLTATSNGFYSHAECTIAFNSGKYFVGLTLDAGATSSNNNLVVAYASKELDGNQSQSLTGRIAAIDATTFIRLSRDAGLISIKNSVTVSNGDQWVVAVDADAGQIWFGWYDASGPSFEWLPATAGGTVGDPALGTNPTYSFTPNGDFITFRWTGVLIGTQATWNFEESEINTALPSGFNVLHTANLPEVTTRTSEHAAITLYSGNATSGRKITTGHQTDFVWGKKRSAASSHAISDVVRGSEKIIRPDIPDAEVSHVENLQSFLSDGCTIGDGTGSWDNNASGQDYWLLSLRAGGAGVSNTDGTITATVSANTVSGFSIVKWTGTGVNATVGHGLPVAPEFIIVKNLSVSNSWLVWHKDLTSNQYYLLFDTVNLETGPFSDPWNSTSPTATTISVGTNSATNGSTNEMVAYCFAGIDALDTSIFKIGSYTGNGNADGPFLYGDGWPLLNMVKRSTGAASGSADWFFSDRMRDPSNPSHKTFLTSYAAGEFTGSAYDHDAVSNGLKWRSADQSFNLNNETFIYLMILADRVAQNNRGR